MWEMKTVYKINLLRSDYLLLNFGTQFMDKIEEDILEYMKFKINMWWVLSGCFILLLCPWLVFNSLSSMAWY